jgi:coenzyme F420-reducing hydrogenase gamma subunit
MFNPLLENLTLLKDAELETKILDLTKKYHIVAKMGQGAVCKQIISILNELKDEQTRRSRDLVKKTQSNQNKNLDDLIKVN